MNNITRFVKHSRANPQTPEHHSQHRIQRHKTARSLQRAAQYSDRNQGVKRDSKPASRIAAIPVPVRT
ncbi:MAG: hypothetical protein H2060_07995 [Azoarcus sp.]|jgi:hypothetical protein|nr:hypothetical protein [Azoarcus sp.]